MTKNKVAKNGNGASLGFEAALFKAADKLRGNMEPSDYKHVVLGLIFLKYISDAFEARHQALLAEDPQAAEDRDEYLADNVFWVPKEARWSHLQANAKQPTIGTLIDDAMRAIEKENESLKGVLPKDYARPALNKVMLGELIDLISGIALGEQPTPPRGGRRLTLRVDPFPREFQPTPPRGGRPFPHKAFHRVVNSPRQREPDSRRNGRDAAYSCTDTKYLLHQ